MYPGLYSIMVMVLCTAGAAAEPPEPATSPDAAWRVKVIELQYADAFEVARALSQVLPPEIRIVPYGPTNSLLIGGPAAVLESVTEDDESPEAASRER